MREIKFRAWDGEKMHAAFDLSQNPKYWWEELQDYPLMQYTGLKDKNGVEIYEGDIMSTYGEVHFEDGRFIAGKSVDISIIKRTQEVIGNIYENKELLNENR